jgi:hypothetical protein
VCARALANALLLVIHNHSKLHRNFTVPAWRTCKLVECTKMTFAFSLSHFRHCWLLLLSPAEPHVLVAARREGIDIPLEGVLRLNLQLWAHMCGPGTPLLSPCAPNSGGASTSQAAAQQAAGSGSAAGQQPSLEHLLLSVVDNTLQTWDHEALVFQLCVGHGSVVWPGWCIVASTLEFCMGNVRL